MVTFTAFKSHVFALQVNGDGQCLFTSIWLQFGFSEDEDGLGPDHCREGKIYTPRKLRLQLVYGVIKMLDVSPKGGVPDAPFIWSRLLHTVSRLLHKRSRLLNISRHFFRLEVKQGRTLRKRLLEFMVTLTLPLETLDHSALVLT